MSCRTALNCGNSCLLPSPITPRHSPTAANRISQWMPPPTMQISRPRLTSGPTAAMNTATVCELPETGSSFYELLGIPESGSYDDIKRAYRHLARKYHPDVSPPDLTEEYSRRFIKVKEAYDTLSDPGHRALYDRSLSGSLHLAFSTRRQFDEEMDEKYVWKNQWRDQLVELNRRSFINCNYNDSEENLTWGARMRRRRR